MKVTIQRSGGFAGITPPPITVDTQSLPKDQADALEQMVRDARFFDQPNRPTGPGRPDQFQFQVTVDAAGGKSHSVTVHEGADAALTSLVQHVRAIARR
jgi:hypothetical protein